jgi:hypothetical protein
MISGWGLDQVWALQCSSGRGIYVACPKGIATEKDSSIREGSRGLGLGPEARQVLLREGEVVVCNVAKGA